MLIDMMLILVVTKVYAPPFNRAAACGACQGWGGIGEHYICMAFTSKIGAWVVSWLPHRPSFRMIWKRFGQ